jgi:Tol biopolymer transport system component
LRANDAGPQQNLSRPPRWGLLSLATPPSDDRQIYPSWSSDATSLLFTSSDALQLKSELRMLDLKTREVSTLPDTAGLILGQISPDGGNIVAVRQETHALILYNFVSHAAKVLAEMADYPRWSSDGRSVYFNNLYYSGKGRAGGVCRWDASKGTISTLLNYPDFLLAGMYGVTFSVTPDGSILLLKDASNRDLYALDLELP